MAGNGLSRVHRTAVFGGQPLTACPGYAFSPASGGGISSRAAPFSKIGKGREKKEVDKVIINSAELEKYFGKDKSPREMKDKIISLLDDWKAKQPPELGKPEKKMDLEK